MILINLSLSKNQRKISGHRSLISIGRWPVGQISIASCGARCPFRLAPAVLYIKALGREISRICRQRALCCRVRQETRDCERKGQRTIPPPDEVLSTAAWSILAKPSPASSGVSRSRTPSNRPAHALVNIIFIVFMISSALFMVRVPWPCPLTTLSSA